jgi:hypothetical protein
MKIKFISDKDFMNNELIIADADKVLMATAKQNIPNTFTTDTIIINKDDLNILEYSKITYTPAAAAAAPADGGAAAAAAAAPDGTVLLDPKISETTILNEMTSASIFTNIEQVRQYLKYDGRWYQTQPTKYSFAQRKETRPVAVTTIGGKKTTTRRRRKAGYNKHRKSNKRR